MAFEKGKAMQRGRVQAPPCLLNLVLLCLLTLGTSAFALDPDVFLIEVSEGHRQLVRKVEEVTLPDGKRQVRLWTSLDGLSEPYVVNLDRLDDAFRVLGTSNPQPRDEWMVSRSWDPSKGGPDRSILGDTPARASIVLTVSPDRSVERVSLKMQMNAFGPVFEQHSGRIKLNLSYDSKLLRVTPGLIPLRKRVPGKELEAYSGVALRLKLFDRHWILPLEEVEGGGLRVIGTEQVFKSLPPGSLRYLNEQEAKEVVSQHAKLAVEPEFQARQKAVLDEMFTYEASSSRLATDQPSLSVWQRCGKFIQSLARRRPTS
jgi:hypothetical protein